MISLLRRLPASPPACLPARPAPTPAAKRRSLPVGMDHARTRGPLGRGTSGAGGGASARLAPSLLPIVTSQGRRVHTYIPRGPYGIRQRLTGICIAVEVNVRFLLFIVFVPARTWTEGCATSPEGALDGRHLSGRDALPSLIDLNK